MIGFILGVLTAVWLLVAAGLVFATAIFERPRLRHVIHALCWPVLLFRQSRTSP